MLTTLSIISLDQGKIWTDPCPPLDEDAALERTVEMVRGGQLPAVLIEWVAAVALRKIRNRQA